MSAPSNPLTMRMEGPSPALEVAKDLARRGVMIAPIAVMIGAAFWGADGAASVGYGLAIVVVNFLLAAWSLGYAARISLALMAGVALFGFLVRLGLITLAVLLVRDASWVELVPLGLTLIITHLGLLFWEMRFVSASLAFPGLKPKPGLDAAQASNSPTISDLSETKEHQ
ncbi:MAG: ATP synthase subunit I [Actinomycetota bacterium]